MALAQASTGTDVATGGHADALELVRQRYGPDVEAALRPPVEMAMRTLALREQHKDLVVRVWDGLRMAVKAFAAELAEQGALHQPDDIFMLTEGELRRLCGGEALGDLAARRRQTIAGLEELEVPPVFSAPAPLVARVSSDPRQAGEITLRGQGIVPGVVRARARVLRDPWDGPIWSGARSWWPSPPTPPGRRCSSSPGCADRDRGRRVPRRHHRPRVRDTHRGGDSEADARGANGRHAHDGRGQRHHRGRDRLRAMKAPLDVNGPASSRLGPALTRERDHRHRRNLLLRRSRDNDHNII